MPQFALLLILVLLPIQLLSGAMTPREHPESPTIRLGAPDTHFVILAQAILFRGAGVDIVWRNSSPSSSWDGAVRLRARFRKVLR